MDITKFIPRSMTRTDYESMRKALREHNAWHDFRRNIPETYLEARAELAEQIASNAVGDSVWVYEWGRDCDMCESSTVYKIPASVMAFLLREKSIYECAEGPTSFRVITPEQAADFQPEFRDRIAEAWDNGNTTPYIV
jgi:hypothetical protein